MLVLSRKRDQEVCLPGLGVTIKVLEVKGNKVRLGFDAPEDIHVLRGELSDFHQPMPREITIPMSPERSYAGQVA